MNELTSTSGVLPELSINRQRQAENQDDSIGQDAFLRLMTAQLQAQDPMEPMQTGEIFSQLAQFGTVSGIQGLQDSFAELSTNLQSLQALQASSMVGQSVLVASDTAQLDGEAPVEGQIVTPPGVQNVSMSVVDSTGQKVATLSLPASGDLTTFSWNGIKDDGSQAAPGRYRFSAQAVSGGELQSLTIRVKANVDSVTILPGSTGYNLNVNGVGTVAPSEVLEIS